MQNFLGKILIFFFLLCCIENSFSQNEYFKLNDIIEYYGDENFTQTISEGNKFLERNPNYKGAELIVLYQMIIASYNSELSDARDKNLSWRVDRLTSEMTPLIRNLLLELDKNSLPDTWLSRSNGWHKPGNKWDKWRNTAKDYYRTVLDDAQRQTTRSGATNNSTNSRVNNNNRANPNQRSNNIDFKNGDDIEIYKISERSSDSILNLTYDKFVGFYTLDADIESIRRKNILLKNSFLKEDKLMIKNYLIFKDSGLLYLLELSDYNTTNKYLNEINKFADSKQKIVKFKSKFKTRAHYWLYNAFLQQYIKKDDELFKTKRGKTEISKKWKTSMRKNFALADLKEVPGAFTNSKTKIFYQGQEFFDVTKFDDDDLFIRNFIQNNYDLLVGTSNNYSAYNRRFNDLKRNISSEFSLLDDLNNVTFSSIYSNRIIDVFSSERKNIFRIIFDENNDLNLAFVNGSSLFPSDNSYSPTFQRVINLIPNGIKLSTGQHFSYSDITFKKHPESDAILELFYDSFLKDGDIKNFENEIISLIRPNNSSSQTKENKDKTDNNNRFSIAGSKQTREVIGTGYGETKEIASQNALKDAIDQGTVYLSSSLAVTNDKVTKDETIAISRTQVDENNEISAIKNSDGVWEVKISAKISAYRESKYIEVKNNKINFDSAFDVNLEEQDANKLNEEKEILSLCENEFDNYIKKSITLELDVSEPVRNNKNNTSVDIGFTVNWKLNENYDLFIDYFWKSLGTLALSELDLKTYDKVNTPYYKFGNIYLRSQKSINTLVRFFSSINYYPSNFYLEVYDKKYFPEGITWDRSSSRRIQKKSNFKFNSTDINISGLVFLSKEKDSNEKRLLRSYRVNRLYTDGDIVTGYTPLNRYTKKFKVNQKSLYQNIFLKNGKIDYRNLENYDSDINVLFDETSVIRAGSHKINLTITKKQRNKGKIKDNVDFIDNNDSGEVNYFYTSNNSTTSNKNNTNKKSSNDIKWAVIDDSDGWSNVRSSQSTRSTILFKIYDNQRFKVLRNDGKWSYVEYNGRKGYMHNSVIKLTSNSNSNSNSNSSKVSSADTNAKIIGDNIWVRNSPSNGKVIMYLENNTNVKLLEYGKKETIRGKTNYWYKIKVDGKTGWVFGSQLRITDRKNDKLKTPPKTNIKDYISPLVYNNLVSYWSFNGSLNAQKGSSFSSSGYSFVYGSDRFGNYSSSFNDNYRLSTNLPGGFSSNKDFTLSFWVNASSYGNKKIFKIIDSNDKYFSIDFNQGQIVLETTAPGSYWGTNSNKIKSSSYITGDLWNHVLISFDFGTTDSFKAYVYVNGSSVDQINGSMLNIKNFTPRKIEHDGSSSVKIDDVSLWNTLFKYARMRDLYGLHRSTDITRAESKKLSN